MATTIYHVEGNPLELAIPLTERVRTLVDGVETETEGSFEPKGDVEVTLFSMLGRHRYTAEVACSLATVRCDDLPFGTYTLELVCKDQQGESRRYCLRDAVKIVMATADAGIDAGTELDAVSQVVEGAVFFYAKGDKGDQGEQGEKGESGVSLGDVAIADNLTTDDATKVLSAKQGYVLKGLIDEAIHYEVIN